jgi:phytanoyl-CoA hydroxylase
MSMGFLNCHLNMEKSRIEFFSREGYLVVENLLSPKEVEEYLGIYNDFLSNKINASNNRVDLAGSSEIPEVNAKQIEDITQIMFPGRILPELLKKVLHQRSLSIAKQLLGEDMELDIDMLIDKAPQTNTSTDWHQDNAYWIDMPDTRAVTCWVALDDVSKDNGCLWYIPKSHLAPPRPHRPSGKLLNLVCNASEDEAVPMEIKKGSCILHHGGTIHYSRGNSTDSHRRAFIMNFRPVKMILYTKEKGYDHPGEKKQKLNSMQKLVSLLKRALDPLLQKKI